MNHQKKLRNIILQLSEPHKIRFLQLYTQHQTALSTHVKKISFNCHESTLQINNHIYNGYGKTHNQALTAGINMLLQAHLKNQANHQFLKEALKKLSINSDQQFNHDKVKTQPDVILEKSRVELVGRTSFGQTKTKETASKGAKSVKQEIFQSLNRSCFKKGDCSGKAKVINQSLTKQPSCVLLSECEPKNYKQQQIQSILNRVRQLQQKLKDALNENQYLKVKLKQKQVKERQNVNNNGYLLKDNCEAKQDQRQVNNKKEMNLLYRESKEAMVDITNKMSTLLQNKENYKLRSFSVSNSAHHSNFNSKIQSKVKIPKLNLQILPNYHGKSNKSLNQSLLQNYEKRAKVNSNV